MAAAGKYPTTDDMVRELWDRQQISDVMLRFGRGLDLHDWDMYAATLTDPFDAPRPAWHRLLYLTHS
jgi:hypothetical protein